MKRMTALFLAMVLICWAEGAGAQYIPDPDIQGKINDAQQRLALTGRIAYAQELGGYFVQGGKAGNKTILNQNYEVLKELAQSRRQVKIQGRVNPFDVKARHIFIESIDDKPYQGDKAPLVKPPTKVTPLF